MGTSGLWKYVEDHGIQYAAHKTKHNHKKDDEGDDDDDAPYPLRPRHLLFDMNALIHGAYNSRSPNTRATLHAVEQSLRRLLAYAPPQGGTLALVFDGVSPMAKWRTQKERRQSLAAQPPQAPPRSSATAKKDELDAIFSAPLMSAEVPLRQEEITAGSEFVLACEFAVARVLDAMERDGTATWSRRIVSSSAQDGEGEVKISALLREIYVDACAHGNYNDDDAISIVGNDSDLLLVCLVATPYRYCSVIDPDALSMTCLHELLQHWERSVPNPPLPCTLLPSYRMDFVFLMLLSGCDYYDGLRSQSLQLWRSYRRLRGDGGFFRRALISGENCDIDVNFLRELMHEACRPSKGQGSARGGRNGRGRGARNNNNNNNTSGSSEAGLALLRSNMWNFKSIVRGRCTDYQYRCPRMPQQLPNMTSLRSAAGTARIGEAIHQLPSHDGADGQHPPISSLEHAIAVLGVRGRYSQEIKHAIAAATSDDGAKLTASFSCTFMLAELQAIMNRVKVERLTEAERLLHQRCSTTEEVQDEGVFMRFAIIPARAAAKHVDALVVNNTTN